jgi:hypothetical protein
LVLKNDTNIKYLQENDVKSGMLGLMRMAIWDLFMDTNGATGMKEIDQI